MTADLRAELLAQIETTLLEFDFAKLHRVMTAVGWHYSDACGVPDIGRLKETAREVLMVALSEMHGPERCVTTGGFEGYVWADGVTLKFVLDSSGRERDDGADGGWTS